MGQEPRRFRLTPRRRPRLGGLSFNRLLPNILTMIGLCAGMTAIRFAMDGRWEPAVTLIVVAAFIDGIVWHLDVGSSHPGAGAGPKGTAVRRLKRYVSWV